ETERQKVVEARERDVAAVRAARKRGYVAAMLQVQKAWECRDVDWMRELLASQVPLEGEADLRAFEWPHWTRKVNSRPRILDLEMRRGLMRQVLVSGDGARVVVSWVLEGNGMRVWDAVTGKVLQEHAAKDARFPLVLSHDGSQVAAYEMGGAQMTI